MPQLLSSLNTLDRSFSEITASSSNRQQRSLSNRLTFVKNLALVLAIVSFVGSFSAVWSVIAERSGPVVIASGGVAFGFCLGSYLIARLGTSTFHANLAGYLLIAAVWSSMALAH